MKLAEDLRYLRNLLIVNGRTKFIFTKGVFHITITHYPDIEGITSGQLAQILTGHSDIDEAVKILTPEIDPHKKQMLLNDVLYANKRR